MSCQKMSFNFLADIARLPYMYLTFKPFSMSWQKQDELFSKQGSNHSLDMLEQGRK